MIDAVYETARQCADLASSMARSFSSSLLQAEKKADKTWVTEADKKIEEELRKFILSRHPDHEILGEEFGGTEQFSSEKFSWVIDPIDGTFSFIHGIPFYSSLIAVLHGSVPVVGFACLPGMNIQMSAIRGQGAWINGVRYVRPKSVGSDRIEIVGTADPYRFRMEGKEAQLHSLYLNDGIKSRTYPDALGYYLLLQGSVRAFVDPKVEVWDVAPFHVILPEAGFAIQNWSGSPTLQRGTSVAYAHDSSGQPLHCNDVLALLKS